MRNGLEEGVVTVAIVQKRAEAWMRIGKDLLQRMDLLVISMSKISRAKVFSSSFSSLFF